MPDCSVPEPWRYFLNDLDQLLTEPVDLHCCGGFVVIHQYGVARTTNDLDYLSAVPTDQQGTLIGLAGNGSVLHEKHRVFLDAVTVANFPDGYQERLIPLFPGSWKNIKLFALEAHDLALSKLERHYERDRDDIGHLARAGFINPETLETRYREELRPYLSNERRHDLTLRLWLEAYFT